MADAPKLQGTEKLGESYYKINMGIDNANEALRRSSKAEVISSGAVSIAKESTNIAEGATNIANNAVSNVNNIQKQLDELVVNGDSSPEAAQARVDIEGKTHTSLKSRLDYEFKKNDSRIKEFDATDQGEKVNLDGGIRLGMRTKKTIVTFTSDDGRIEDYTKIKPLFQSKGIPLTMGLIPGLSYDNPNRTSVAQIKELLGMGWEVASHTYSHPNLATLTDQQIDDELRKSKEALENTFGIPIKHIIFPYGGHDARVRNTARKYYRSSTSTDPGHNGDVHRTYALKRVALGSYFDVATPGYPATNTLEYYKRRVDEAVANNAWLIFMMHPWNEQHDSIQQQYLSELIDYIKSLSIPIMGVEDALDRVGNLMDIGDYGSPEGYFSIGSKGITETNYSYRKFPSTGINNDSLLSSYPKDVVSTMIFTGPDNAGFPEGAGTLETYYISGQDFAFQIYYPYNNETWYRRRWDSTNKKWLSWIKWELPFVISSSTNAYASNISPLSLPSRKVIYTRITAAGASGYPNANGGVLLTNTVAFDSGLIKQTFYDYNNNKMYERSGLDGDKWSDWESNVHRIGITYNNFSFGTIPAQGQAEQSFMIPGVKTSDIVVATPRSGLETGLMWSAYINAADTIIIRVVNVTTSSITSPSRQWSISVTR